MVLVIVILSYLPEVAIAKFTRRTGSKWYALTRSLTLSIAIALTGLPPARGR